MRVLILNGPNLNMLGIREPHLYGTQTLADIKNLCEGTALLHAMTIDFRQSNHEGELVTWIQQARTHCDALIINAAAYTHTSVALHDALKLLEVPILEVHLTDPATREAFRHHSYIEPLAAHTIKGHGPQGYQMALEWLARER